MTAATPSIIDACASPALFKPWFRDPKTWRAWFAFFEAKFGLPMSEETREIYRQCANREDVPEGGFAESWLIVGRRGGKSRALALIASYLSTFIDWSPFLSPGETATVIVLAADKKQARTIFRYAKAMLGAVPAPPGHEKMIARETAEEIELANGVVIEIAAASFKTVRSRTAIAILADEIAFWPTDESANPDVEILNALRPAMATIPGARLLCASSPYARKGELWRAYQRYHGKAGAAVLTWKADTKTMNPTVHQAIIDEAYERDPAAAAAEYGAEFRSDVEAFLTREVIESVTVPERYELPPMSCGPCVAFFDAAGGSGGDSITQAVAFRDKDGRAILALVRERKPPFSPHDVIREFAGDLKAYGVTRVVGDRWGGEWPRETFRQYGIDYEVAAQSKSDIYRDCLPLLNSGRVELLDLPRLSAQFVGLERRTARGGKDSIDHAPGAHDDVANAVSGALLLAAGKREFRVSDEVMQMLEEHFFGVSMNVLSPYAPPR